MKKLWMSLAVAAATFGPAVALACDGEKASLPTITAQEGKKLNEAKSASFVDANSAETRTKFGVVPGAILLTSHDEYAASELPTDKNAKLVFYCAAEQCGAAKKAAVKAVHAGYNQVTVMPEGIKGWTKAGFPTASAAKSAAPAKNGQS